MQVEPMIENIRYEKIDKIIGKEEIEGELYEKRI